MPDNFDEKMQKIKPSLSEAEVEAMWQQVAPSIVAAPSPYFSRFHFKPLTSVLVLLLIFVGVGSTAAVSEAARPGDVLFPLERAIERVRLAIASEEKAAELKTNFASKRLAELEDIITEVSTTIDDSSENNENLTRSIIVDDRGEERISLAVNVLLDFLEEVEDEDVRQELLDSLLSQVTSVSVRGRGESESNTNPEQIKLRQDESRLRIDDKRIEYKDDGYRLRIENDKEVRGRVDDKIEDDDWEDEGENDDDSKARVQNSDDNEEDELDISQDKEADDKDEKEDRDDVKDREKSNDDDDDKDRKEEDDNNNSPREEWGDDANGKDHDEEDRDREDHSEDERDREDDDDRDDD